MPPYPQKAVGWKLSGTTLKLSFDSTYSANAVQGDLPVITKKVSEILDQKIEIKVGITSSSQSNNKAVDEDIELVKRVFRGEIIKGE